MTAEEVRSDSAEAVDPFEFPRPNRPVWLVGLQGDENALRYLAKETQSDAMRVRKLGREWVMFAERLQGCGTAEKVAAAAPDLIQLASAIRRRKHPFGASIEGTGEYRLHPDGRREIYVSLIERFAITDDISIDGAHATEPSYCDRLLKLALSDEDVREILRYREAPDAGGWTGLRRITEAIAKNLAGGRSGKHASLGYKMIACKRWAEDCWLRELGEIANSSGAGESARHGLSHTAPPPNAMDIHEGRRGVDAVFYRWIDWKLSQR